VETSAHCCPNTHCRYRGWVGCGNIRANGHPDGGPWRQLPCIACHRNVLETHGTLFHGKRVSAERLVWAVAALAEGLGIRSVARVFEVDPNTVLQWVVEAADQLQAFSRDGLHGVHVSQVPLDERFAVLSEVKVGELREAEAIERVSRAPHWVWGAIDPVSKLLLAIDVGERTLVMAPCVVHQVVQVLAPGCVPLLLTDRLKEYATALLSHFGHWMQPPRQRAPGPVSKPRWMPLPQLRYAQRRSSSPLAADVWSSAPWPASTGCWLPRAGRSIPRSSSGRTSRFASMWRRAAGASSPSAQVKTAYASH
jgi:hypothetical protein